MKSNLRIISVVTFLLLAAASGYYVTQLKFSFDFEQFFPEGDEDLEFFRDFIENFEGDDNFLLVAVRREGGVFEQGFLERFHGFSLDARNLPYVTESQSLTKFSYPLRTPFAITTIPAIHIDQPERYAADRERILNDERFVHNLISADGETLVVFLKTKPSIQLDEARELMAALEEMVNEQYQFAEYHYLGRPFFQQELVDMQKREITVSAIVSGILVSLIMFFIFRKPWGIFVALISIGLGMLLFMGLLGASGRELNAMAALYPVLMIIVGTSDVVHIMSKYIDELRKGEPQDRAIVTTIKEIGLATLLTSITTAIGFASLLTSKVGPIRDFGINAAIGVIVAYVTVIFFTTAVLSWFRADQIMKMGRGQAFWEKSMSWAYQFTLRRPTGIALGAVATLGLALWGISLITTNYGIINNMPRGEKITEDFRFFEKHLTGFRPMEIAVFAKNGHQATDWEVIREIAKVENYLKQYPYVQAVGSVTAVYKSINQMMAGNSPEAYRMPESEQQYERYQRMARQVPKLNVNVLLSEDGTKARITSRIQDIGADSIKAMGERMDRWIVANTDTSAVAFQRTGTGLIIDKNAEYVRRDLLYGLGMAVVIVSFLMALLFRNVKMLLISLVPNIFPLILAGALLGFLGIELEAGVSIVFAVIFGIAVDDTIHFLSKYKLAKGKGLSREEAMKITFTETGKAIVLTSVILFFGFLVMLFSIHPPSVTIGLLISLTLVSALVSDLLLIPLMIRWMMKAE
ncbi:efflux RND transporter permease subunit [Phaeodactylibacter luteus]|uniref:MMPL family transporter n=1 Tax=Phaeodactylibacter luteus TaxID=1564516 RepID=A0A5C6RZS8_9BACT|nr:MMPL family transporter [Phaeodactylibacter luteus]TXB67908.1 MMPL family transporter [Phaeodactylibacter luteus]